MKEKMKWNDYDSLPLILDVTDIQHIMGISRASAYELVHTPGFPVVRSGRLIKISKKAFFNWLDSGGNSHENEKRKQHNMRRIFMMKLSKYEKETIINWNEAESTASIYTFNADLKRRLAEFSRKYPQLCWLERSTTEGSVTYVIEKSRLSVRLISPYSEERLAAARKYAKQHGFQVLRTEKESA